MKISRLFILVILILQTSATSLFAQKEMSNGLLFPKFEKGYSISKENQQFNAFFNFDMVDQKMIFQTQTGEIAEINPQNVSVIEIGSRKFYPTPQGSFYEGIEIGDQVLYIERKCRILSTGKDAGFGTTSNTSAISGGSVVTGVGNRINLSSNEYFETKTDINYLLMQNNKFKRFNSTKSLCKLFDKSHQKSIEEFAKSHSVDYKNPEEVKAIVEYCYSLEK